MEQTRRSSYHGWIRVAVAGCAAMVLTSCAGVQLSNRKRAELAYVEQLCFVRPFVGDVKGVRFGLDARYKRRQSAKGDMSAEKYRRLSQEMKGYDTKWELLYQKIKLSCYAWALCEYRQTDTDASDCQVERKAMERHHESAQDFLAQPPQEIPLPQVKNEQNKQIASIEFENARPFVDKVVLTNKQWNGYHFQVQIHNKSYDSTIRVNYWKLTDLRYLEEGSFKPWKDAEPVLLEWRSTTPRKIAPRDKVLVAFARVYPPEYQREYDRILSGDVNTPQLRFNVLRWPRRMTSHVPPGGTHRFRLTVFFEEAPPAEIELELEWAGQDRGSVESMAQEIKFRTL